MNFADLGFWVVGIKANIPFIYSVVEVEEPKKKSPLF